jgi:hypothetical protein
MFKKIKQFIPFIFILIFTIIGIVGYSIEKSKTPIRVLFKSKGGYVIFSHEAHVRDYDLRKCQSCHHNIQPPASLDVWRCRDCHHEGSEYENICEDKAPHIQCVGAKCVECHTGMGFDPKDCSFCHKL